MITFHIHNVSFQLVEKHDWTWLEEMGEVFAVFDQQDSGNISFGIEKNGMKKFIKYAGAKTVNYKGSVDQAIQQLKRAIYIYEDLKHEQLVTLIDHFPTPAGYAAVFEWSEGECLHPHWSYPPPAKYEDPASPYYRFKQLPIEMRLASLDDIFSFHEYVEKSGYVAVDFYDGSILYDFAHHHTRICDIDLYQKRPFINKMGHLWGSSRFMSPEEFTYGAAIDQVTNCFHMGAVAFVLVGGGLDRSLSEWEAGEALYQVALRAVESGRECRYSSVAEFYEAWKQAKGEKYEQDSYD